MLEYFGFYDTKRRTKSGSRDEESVPRSRPSFRTQQTQPVDMARRLLEVALRHGD